MSPKGVVTEYKLYFGFNASNNEAKYKVLITGLNIAKELNIEKLKALSIYN